MKRISAQVLLFILSAVLLLVSGQTAYAEGSAPIAENLELTTYRNISVGGKMSAFDPDGGALRFEVTTEPVKGELQIEEDGGFVYTPKPGKKGRDYFGYKAYDQEGNASQEATVIIRIEKAKKTIQYTDMTGRGEEYAAVRLYETGLLTGEKIGNDVCFHPDRMIPKGEFISLCVKLSGQPVYAGVLQTSFTDDSRIPIWMKGYAAAAALSGLTDSDTLNPEDFIRVEEAAEILDHALHVTEVHYLSREKSQACINLEAAGVLADGVPDDYLTRAEMAKMLCGAMDLMNKR